MSGDDPVVKKIKVFILLGQSNMVGMGFVKGEDKDGSLEYAVKTKHLYQYLVDDNHDWKEVVNPHVRNFFTMGSGNNDKGIQVNELLTVKNLRTIGPEIGIGVVVGQWFASQSDRCGDNDGNDDGGDQILLLKSCIGNRSLGWDLLPPGSPSFEYTDEKDEKKYHYAGYKESPARWEVGTDPKPGDWYAGEQYDGDVARAKEILSDLPKYVPGATSSTSYEVAGFFYWQGDKDRYDKAYGIRYETNLIQLIRQLRKEFSAPNAKFVLATLGQTPKEPQPKESECDRNIFNAQMDVPKLSEFVRNVACVYSNPFCHGGASNGHYNHNAETYMDVGLAMGRTMVDLLDANKTRS